MGEATMRCPSASLADAAAHELTQLLEEGFDTWAFDTFKLARITGGQPVRFAGWEAMRRNGFFTQYAIDPDKAQRFLKGAESMYETPENVPYHNNLHAADVTQAVHALLGDIGFRPFFDQLSSLTLVLSAVIHDMGHDGHSNNFHINMQDDLAVTYNDRSVLENFHVSQAFRLLASEDSNVLEGLEKEQATCARKQMIEEVLGTDMAHHFSKLGSFKNILQKLPLDPSIWCEDPEALAAFRVMALHAADISN